MNVVSLSNFTVLMNNIATVNASYVPGHPGFMTQGELQVLSLMARKKVSLRQVKDAIQSLHSTDILLVEAFLGGTEN